MQLFFTGSGAPVSTPSYVGRFYLDLTNDAIYVSTGTASAADWISVTGFIWQGAWSSVTAYSQGDVVSYANKLYTATSSSTNSIPSALTNWSLLLSAITGSVGAAGKSIVGLQSKTLPLSAFYAGNGTYYDESVDGIVFPNADSYCLAKITMQNAWDTGDVYFGYSWSHAATTVNFQVAVDVAIAAVNTADSLTPVYGTAKQYISVGGDDTKEYKALKSAIMSIGNFPRKNADLVVKITRNAATEANDTLAAAMYLKNFTLFYTTEYPTDDTYAIYKGIDIDTTGDVAYIAADTFGIVCLNIAATTYNVPPVLLNIYSNNSLSRAADIKKVGSYLFVADADYGLYIYNITSPGTLSFVSKIATTRYVKRVEVSADGNTVYLSDSSNNLTIVDTTTKASPSITYAGNLGWTALWELAINGTTLYAAAGDKFYIIDVTTPATPSVISSVTLGSGICIGVTYASNTLYLAAWSGGVYIYDITTPATPTETSHFTGIGLTKQVKLYGSYMLVSIRGSVKVLLTSTGAVQSTTALTEPTELFVDGANVYTCASLDGLYVYDVTVPTAIALETTYTSN
jgi:hypothetical protein